MGAIVIIDSSVLLNVFDVPTRNQQREAVLERLGVLINNEAHLFIPMVAIVEVGNHIAQLADGNQRRQAAIRFVTDVQAAIEDRAPWKPINFPSIEVVTGWLKDFPDSASQGVGMGDLAIKHEFHKLTKRHPMSHVWVWSLDIDLQGLEQKF